MRNPVTVPIEALALREVARDANGNALDPREPLQASYEVLAGLITDWRAYDATALGDDQPLLPLPPTAESVGRLPSEIQDRISNEVAERRNPTRTPTT